MGPSVLSIVILRQRQSKARRERPGSDCMRDSIVCGIHDYESVHPAYGTLEDFKKFLAGAHERGIRVIIEMVLNHTSDQHPWFQESRSSQNNPRRDWYVWSETDTRYRGTRIIFVDTEMSNWAWDPISKSYYWHRFFSHQLDLNN